MGQVLKWKPFEYMRGWEDMEVSLLAMGKVELKDGWGYWKWCQADRQHGDQLVGGHQLEPHHWHTFPASWGDS